MMSGLVYKYRYFDKRDADEAIDEMDGRSYDGRELRVAMAKYARPNGGGGGGGRFGDRRGGGGGGGGGYGYDRNRRR